MESFSLQAMQFEGTLFRVDVLSGSGAAYALMLSKAVPMMTSSFVLVEESVDLSPFYQRQVLMEGQVIGMDNTCHYVVPVVQLESIQCITLGEDFEDAFEFTDYIASITKAGVDYACWQSWIQGDCVYRGKDGKVVAIFPDGTEHFVLKDIK